MADWPDIIVTSSDSPEILLAVGVKSGGAVSSAEQGMKAYMSGRRCPAGIVVTPEETLILRNRYTSDEPESVQVVGRCPTVELLGAIPRGGPAIEADLARRIQDWLENLRISSRQSWPPAIREAIEWDVIPAVLSGVVGSTGLRYRRTG